MRRILQDTSAQLNMPILSKGLKAVPDTINFACMLPSADVPSFW